MISLVAYGLLVLVLLAIVIVVTMVGGAVSIEIAGYEVTTTFPRLVLVVAGIALIAVVLVWLVGWIWKGPRKLHQMVMRRRRERGYVSLTSGLVAIAAGDAREARRHARKADALLGHPPLTLLLTAQAAQLDGDAETAEKQFTAMLDRPETEFLGLRGLMAAALRRGACAAARDYAVRAHALRPDARWAAESVFDLQTLAGDWNGARRTLETALDRKAVSVRTGRKRRAALLLEEGRQAFENLDRGHALKRVREAHAEAPDLVPATALLARLLIDDQKLRQAARVIEKVWPATPHPELAAIY
ncbi:MAG: heme biosynthesis protein HemY, partial [Rhodospirillales bacterium]|nr:heme biosynthesis protein HemY [Rhodospirillales bacterium]